MRSALLFQSKDFADEMAQRYRDASEDDRLDMLAFFEGGGPRQVHEARLKHEDDIPTSQDLEDLLNE